MIPVNALCLLNELHSIENGFVSAKLYHMISGVSR